MTERAYKYRFYPTAEQENLLRRTMGCVRLVYNKALATRTIAWYQKQERIDYQQTSSMLTAWKKTDELDFLNEVSCVPLQQGLRHLQKADATPRRRQAFTPQCDGCKHRIVWCKGTRELAPATTEKENERLK